MLLRAYDTVVERSGYGQEIRQESIEKSGARDARAQTRHVAQRPIGQESNEPQAGHRDRSFRGTQIRSEGAQAAEQQETPHETPHEAQRKADLEAHVEAQDDAQDEAQLETPRRVTARAARGIDGRSASGRRLLRCAP